MLGECAETQEVPHILTNEVEKYFFLPSFCFHFKGTEHVFLHPRKAKVNQGSISEDYRGQRPILLPVNH